MRDFLALAGRGRRMIGRGSALALMLVLAACGDGGLGSLAEGPRAKVVSVRNGDTVTLDSGQTVRLAGVEAPKGDQPYAEEARQALTDLLLGQGVQLYFGGARQDAYGRTLAHLKRLKGGQWVERVLLERGDGRVHTYADNRALVPPMLDAEARARAARRGLWALDAYEVRLPEEAAAQPFGFQIVEGRVSSVDQGYGGLRLDLEHWVSAEASATAQTQFRSVPLQSLGGRLVRVRGWLRPGPGEAVLKLDHPEQIELIKTPG